ncbi:hypothetical protein [Mesorhizobium caraganae]|uniref:hypothetical protein n=1 Tax=Mesorhizobium caraganae TaxID=483206 RepID=UPI00333BD9B2
MKIYAITYIRKIYAIAYDANVSAGSGGLGAPAETERGRDTLDILLKHISPLSWEPINLTGIYTWNAELQMPNGYDETRPERRLCR